MVYTFKSLPYTHQQEIFDRTRHLDGYGLFWEQGCGKSKPTIDTAASLYEEGRLDAMVVVAPSGVERNWISDEIPVHLPDHIAKRGRAIFYDGGKARGKTYQSFLKETMEHKGFVTLAMSYDALCTEIGRAYAGQFMRKRRCMLVPDESQYIKNPDAIRTRTVLAASKFAPYRRVLSGTPSAQGAFDFYPQIKTIDSGFWERKGLKTWTAFKTFFGEFEEKPFGPGGRNIKILKAYRNLETLNKWLTEVTHRLTKDDALDLPPKTYRKRYVELTAEQWRVYKELKNDIYTTLASGAIIEAPMVITQMLRLQQIVCGYVTDIDGNVVTVCDKNPRLDTFAEEVEDYGRPGIVWARFTKDIDLIMERLERMGKRPVRYDGRVDSDQRAINKKKFQDGTADWFVGNQQAGATGLTLLRGRGVWYYSNSFKLVDRLQSEDRPHRIGQDEEVMYTDLVAPDTIDEKLVNALRAKRDVASQILGDQIKEWI